MHEGDLIDQRGVTEWARALGSAGKPRFRLILAVSLLTAGLVVGPPVPAPAGPLDGFSSDNVTFVRNIRVSAGAYPWALGGRLVGRYFYVRSYDGMEIYDVSDPEAPERIGGLGDLAVLETGVYQDPDTNGEIFLMAGESPEGIVPDLIVVDVSDKRRPRVIGRLTGAVDHTYTCVLNCRWAYGSGTGAIIDLRDPHNPRRLQETWSAGLEFSSPPPYSDVDAADLTEVAPGWVLTASVPMYLLDVRRDPTHPRVVASSDGAPHSLGGVAWPRFGKGDVVLSWSEIGRAPRCEARDLAQGTSYDTTFKTWDASTWKGTRLITGIDQFFVENGSYTDGDPALSGIPLQNAGCGAAWFDVHPDFRDGGLVAHATSGHGTKFLHIDRDGSIDLVGYFLPHAAHTLAAYWITDEIVYTADAQRGIDILRFTGGSE